MKNKIIAKNYGSIPHLSASKMSQQADKKITCGQELILTSKPRDWKDLIVLTEKIDGSNVGVAKKHGEIHAITRAGYDATTSPFWQHHAFQTYVDESRSLFDWLPEGWRICGEWCIVAHGTIMDITDESPFVAFDIFRGDERLPFLEFFSTCKTFGIPMVPLLHIGSPISIKNAVKLLGCGHYGKPEKPEGCVWRCEKDGRVEFLAKWVRSDKEDGKYLDSEILNTGAERWGGKR